MSERVLAIIWIGGHLEENRATVLIDAITNTNVYAEIGDTYFHSCNTADLVSALTPQSHLYLCDDSAPSGDMPNIKATCRRLGLAYRHWHEALNGIGARVETWSPGMERPLTLAGDHGDSKSFLVSGSEVSRALVLLERGRDDAAASILDALVPRVPVLPRFRIGEPKEAASMVSNDPHISE